MIEKFGSMGTAVIDILRTEIPKEPKIYQAAGEKAAEHKIRQKINWIISTGIVMFSYFIYHYSATEIMTNRGAIKNL